MNYTFLYSDYFGNFGQERKKSSIYLYLTKQTNFGHCSGFGHPKVSQGTVVEMIINNGLHSFKQRHLCVR